MTATEITLDTNILFYAFDPADAAKHSVSRRILNFCNRRSATVALQCLSEFYASASRKNLIPTIEAAALVEELSQILSPVAYNLQDVFAGMELQRISGLQFFDCQIVATIARAGCTILLTEDMQHGRILKGVRILNPFSMDAKELDDLIA